MAGGSAVGVVPFAVVVGAEADTPVVDLAEVFAPASAGVAVPVLAGAGGVTVLPVAVLTAGGVVAVPIGVDGLVAPGCAAVRPKTGGPIGAVWEGVGAGEDGLTAVPLVPEAGVLAVVGP